MREFWLKDEKNAINMLLPVSLPSYEIDYGNDIETISASNVGDINIAGHRKLSTVVLKCFFPENEYVFSNKTLNSAVEYVNVIKKWVDDKAIVRFIISDGVSTKINEQYYIESIVYSEDGQSNGDINYTITLREFRKMQAKKASSSAASENSKRDSAKSEAKSKKYTVVAGDNLSKISRKMYGDASKWKKIYDANKALIGKNPNIIFPGQTYSIP